MKSFSDDFLRQTNLLIGEPAPFDNGGAVHSMQNLIANLDGITGQLGDFGTHIEEKKERKKRTHDPNAPKRPLTPYFLYMQTARPIIANDLGQDAPKGAVQEEGQRRWASMTPAEKNVSLLPDWTSIVFHFTNFDPRPGTTRTSSTSVCTTHESTHTRLVTPMPEL